MEKSSDKRIDPSDKRAKVKNEWEKVCTKVILCFITGEEYERKEKTVDEWMDRDARKDELFEQTNLSINPYCLNCKSALVFEHKTFFGHDDQHILFMYGCNHCQKARAFFEDGQEHIPENPKCPKCGALITERVQKGIKKLTIFRYCKACGFDDNYIFYDEEKVEEPDTNFDKDRKRFCLTKEEGENYLRSKRGIESLNALMAEQKERDKDKPFYDQIDKMERLTVIQLKQFLLPKLEVAGFSALIFSKPKIERHVIINFTVEDSKDNREKYDSIQGLRRLMNKLLYNTNWNLMTNGPDYRLGVLSGQLKGLESEEDLLLKVKKRKMPMRS